MKKEYRSRLKKRNDQFQRDEEVCLKEKDWYVFFPIGTFLSSFYSVQYAGHYCLSLVIAAKMLCKSSTIDLTPTA